MQAESVKQARKDTTGYYLYNFHPYIITIHLDFLLFGEEIELDTYTYVWAVLENMYGGRERRMEKI